MGVDVTVLHALENDLWDEMNAAVEDNISRAHSRQSSDSGTILWENVSFTSGDYKAWEW